MHLLKQYSILAFQHKQIRFNIKIYRNRVYKTCTYNTDTANWYFSNGSVNYLIESGNLHRNGSVVPELMYRVNALNLQRSFDVIQLGF